MVSIAQETEYSGNETSLSYDLTAIRRIREDNVATW